MLASVISSTTVSAATTSAITTSAATTSAVTSSATVSAISMTTNMGLPEYGVLVVIALILMLSAKEILSASNVWNRAINCSLNMGIIPLLISFSAIVCYNVIICLG
ncbi:MAG: hypothetical protein P1P80_04760 [ANME-2 cluster archaeon]|nr:hypothetical protein [ANME-2 cluster archaeon]